MIENFTTIDLKKNRDIQKNFLTADFKELKLKCNIYSGDFYLDSFNYFLINNKYQSFNNLFTKDLNQDIAHFFSNNFFETFKNNIKNLKEYNNLIILGSNAANNYYSNLLQFLPRIFFIKDNDVKIAIHRNSSSKYRKFLKLILNSNNINFSFVYLDDGFYKFTESKMPQFLTLENSINVLKNFLSNNNIARSENKKIYVTRGDSYYRKIINETDIIPLLRDKGFKVINPDLYNIDEQIRIFSEAEIVLGPHGSNLSNIIFCKPETKIYEILPSFQEKYETAFKNKYKNLAKLNNLQYFEIFADSVSVTNHSKLAIKYLPKKILENSNYYKDLIIKVKDIKDLN